MPAADETEGEEAVAEAEARAHAARARAVELRRQAEQTLAGESFAVGEGSADRSSTATAWPRRLGIAAAAAGVLLVCGSAAASGAMYWQHRHASQHAAHVAEFAAAATTGVANVMSMDFTDSAADIQRVLDSSTGEFRDEFEAGADGLSKAVEQSKITSEVKVDAVAVESMAADSAVVLVSATSQVSDPKGKRPPARFRLAVTVDRDGGQLKVAKIDFVQ